MAKLYGNYERILKYFQNDPQAKASVSKLPQAIKRKMITDFAQVQAGHVFRNKATIANTILSDEFLEQDQQGKVVPIHERLMFKNAKELADIEYVGSPPAETHRFVINDIHFDVLPSQIKIQYQTHTFKNNTLRSQGPTKIKSGRGIISIQAQLFFVGLDEINTKLRRLVAQARILPICYIQNEFIQRVIYPEDVVKNTAVVITNLSISTYPEAVDTLIVNLSMEVFNWEVFSKDFYFAGLINSPDNIVSNTDKPVVTPSMSPLFTSYWDAILDNQSITATFSKKDLQGTPQGSLPPNRSISMPLYKTKDSFVFSKITQPNWDEEGIKLSYEMIKTLPKEVLDQIANSNLKDKELDIDRRTGEPVDQFEHGDTTLTFPTDAELDRIVGNLKYQNIAANTPSDLRSSKPSTSPSSVTSNRSGFENKSATLSFSPYTGKPWAPNSVIPVSNKIPYQAFLNYAKKIGTGKPYILNVNRNRLDGFDCASLVYNTLKAFGIYIGSGTGTFMKHLRRLYQRPVFAGPLDETNRLMSKTGFPEGKNLVDFKGNLEGHIILTLSPISKVNPDYYYHDYEEYVKSGTSKMVEGPFHQALQTKWYYVEHIALISKDKGYGSKNRFTLFHAYGGNGYTVKETSIGTIRGSKNRMCYHEVYPIPGALYEQTEEQRKLFQESVASVQLTNVDQRLGAAVQSQLKDIKGFIDRNVGDVSLKMYEASRRYSTALVKALKSYLAKNKQWEIAWLRNGGLLLKTPVTFDVKPGDDPHEGPVLTNISLSVANTFARIPMIQHELVTHQYLGGGDCTVWLQFKCLGLKFIHQLNAVRKYTEAAARNYRLLDNAGLITINHPILQLVGSKQFLIESIEESTDPESPDLYNVTVQLTEQRLNQREDEQFTQEFGIPKKVEFDFIEGLLKDEDNIYKVIFADGVKLKISYLPDANKIFLHPGGSYMNQNNEYRENRLYTGDISSKANIFAKENLYRQNIQKKLFPTITHDIGDSYSKVLPEINSKKYLFQMMSFYFFYQLLDFIKEDLLVLGVTKDDLIKWSKDNKHPLYSFGIFSKIPIEKKIVIRETEINGFGDLFKHQESLKKVKSIKKSSNFGFENEASYINFYTAYSATLEKNINSRYEKFVKQKANPFYIPSSPQFSFLGTVYDWGLWGLNLFRGLTNSVLSVGESWLDLAKKNLSTELTAAIVQTQGSQIKEAEKLFSSTMTQKETITRTTFDPSQIDIGFSGSRRSYSRQVSNVLNTYKDLSAEVRLKAGLNLIAAFTFFRGMMSQLSRVAMRQMKYTDQLTGILSKGNSEEMSFFGLPAYQDIPCPYIDFSGKDFKDLKAKLSDVGRPSVYYLNPDFFFYNHSDSSEMSGDSVAFITEKATRMMLSNLHLTQSLAVAPSDANSPNKVNIGPLAVLGSIGTLQSTLDGNLSSTNPRNADTNTDGDKPKDLVNRLPDISGLFTQNEISRSYNLGRTAAGLALGFTANNPVVGNVKHDKKIVDDKTKRNPLVLPQYETVNFGPSTFETRVRTLMDRSPQRNLQSMITAFKSRNYQPYRMRRAMPAFKLYFIEDDTSGIGGLDKSSFVRSYDDFFSFKALKEIQFISSRNMPASHLIIRVSNLFGNLDTLEYSNSIIDKDSVNRARDTETNGHESIDMGLQDRPEENPFVRFILKEGIRVQFKAGNDNNPSELPVVFNGQVVQVNQENGDELVIVCQSFGTQLVADVKGPDKNSIPVGWVDTFELLSYMICQPEMTMFGRWTLDSEVSVGESRSRGGWEKVFQFLADPKDDNIYAPSREATIGHFADNNGSFLSQLFRKGVDVMNALQGSTTTSVAGQKVEVRGVGVQGGRKAFEITVPGLVFKNGDWEAASGVSLSTARNNSLKIISYSQVLESGASKMLNYHVYRTTVWDIFKEMELRHPGWISHPVNYAARMTMFFGQPSQLYWYRPMNKAERVANINRNQSIQAQINASQDYAALTKKLAQYRYTASEAAGRAIVDNFYTILDWGTFLGTIALTAASIKAGGAAGILGATTRASIMPLARRFLIGGAIGYGITAGFTNDSSTFTRIGGGIMGGLLAMSGVGAVTGGLKTIGTLLFQNGVFRAAVAGTAVATLGLGQIGRVADNYFRQQRLMNLIALGSMENKIKSDLNRNILKDSIGNRMKPFRDYHFIDSKHHIIANQIKSSTHGIYNGVTLEYTSDPEDSIQEVMVDPTKKQTKILKASHRILDKDLRMGFFSHPNCRGLYMADRYAQGLLMRHFKDSYKGQLLVLGDWNIKPYDRIVLEDNYTGMYGQFEVEQVVTTVSPEVGCITEITPDMVVYGNNIVDMPYDNFHSAYLAWNSFSYPELLQIYLSNDPSKFVDRMMTRDQKTGGVKGVSNLDEDNARFLNSLPGTIILSAVAGVGAGLGFKARYASDLILGGSNVAAGAAGVVTGAAVGTVTPAVVGGGGFADSMSFIKQKFGAFGSLGMKFYEWSTSRQPLIFEPLWLNGKPMLPSIDMDKVSMLQNIRDNFQVITGNINRGFNILADGGKAMIFGDFNQTMQGLGG